MTHESSVEPEDADRDASPTDALDLAPDAKPTSDAKPASGVDDDATPASGVADPDAKPAFGVADPDAKPASDAEPVAKRRGAKLALVTATAAMLITAWRLGAFEVLAEPERLRTWIVDRGAWGQLVFVLAYTLLQPFGVPGTVFLLVAPLLWPWPEAYALTMIGTMTASVVGFSFARFVARDFVERRIPARFRAYEDALERRAFATVVTLRFVLWMPPALHAFFGVSRVSFATHFWGSLVGYALPLLAMAYFGERLFAWLSEIPAFAWAIAGAVLVAIALVALALWLRRRASKSTPDRAT